MIKVLQPGIYNTVQDSGRIGYAHFGVPISGYLDTHSAQLGNALLYSNQNNALIEITFGQGEFQFLQELDFCLTGADYSPKLDGIPIQMNRVYSSSLKSILSFGKRDYGARTYLAVKGGIQTDLVLNSRSFTQGITQFKLEQNDILFCKKGEKRIHSKHAIVAKQHQLFSTNKISCYQGPEYHLLSEQQIQKLRQEFTLSTDNNRVGYRLNETISNNLPQILTSSVLPGTVQLTPSGQLIILMNDCQVTGGYPRILQLSQEAISILSQKLAGENILFEFFTIQKED